MQTRQLVLAWVETFNRADVYALTAFYSDDAVNHQVVEQPVPSAPGSIAVRG